MGGGIWRPCKEHHFNIRFLLIVSSGGIVNVGSLNVSTPTQGFVDGFFLSPGNPNDAAVAQLLAGTAP